MGIYRGNGVELYYELHGSHDGPVLVFTHGAGWDHEQWTPQIEEFSKDFRVLVWDVRSHGRSSCSIEPLDGKVFSQDLINLLDHLEIDKAILIGCSMGGHISLRTAVERPDKVAAVVAMGTPVTSAFNWHNRLNRCVKERCLRKLTMEFIDMSLQSFSFFAYGLSMRLLSMDTLAKMHAKGLSIISPQLREYFYRVTVKHEKEQWIRIFNAVSRMELLEDLPKVSCPTMVIEGDAEWMMRRQHRFICDCIEGTVHRLVSSAGHAANLDNPEKVNYFLREFFTHCAFSPTDKADECPVTDTLPRVNWRTCQT
ncbi:alpha/beta hydrolase [Heliorestis acidaminivorans]|uniref:Alpha/beta hydrolase n=1 Tax=Heliorestis acidaminivorans TaxID=553427 RepID=A0A6I0F0M3_9FIRM|nr:alpha/beta hydrolase [Heliorestis acidaminivorans]KAB2952874.1 alpha/beta hydrolase [Heliorestis acidaminivorans]